MSYHSKSTIKINSNKIESKDKYLLKGNTSTSDSEVHFSDEETIVIRGRQGKGSYQISLKPLRESLHKLKLQSHVQIRHLTPENSELFKVIVEVLELLNSSPVIYQKIIDEIHEIFADVKEIRPGTISAYFMGCTVDNSNFNGPLGCNPTCTTSLSPSTDNPGFMHCDDNVLIYNDNAFSSINDTFSTHAYIYIGDEKFSGFTHDNIIQLRKANIEKATLIYGNSDGSFREVISDISVDQLPKNTSHSPSPSSVVEEIQTSNNDNYPVGGAIVLIIIVIIVILLCAYLYYRQNMAY